MALTIEGPVDDGDDPEPARDDVKNPGRGALGGKDGGGSLERGPGGPTGGAPPGVGGTVGLALPLPMGTTPLPLEGGGGGGREAPRPVMSLAESERRRSSLK